MVLAIGAPTVIALYGVCALMSAIAAYVLASAKARDAGFWATWALFLPPALLVLILLPKFTTEQQRQQIQRRRINATLED